MIEHLFAIILRRRELCFVELISCVSIMCKENSTSVNMCFITFCVLELCGSKLSADLLFHGLLLNLSIVRAFLAGDTFLAYKEKEKKSSGVD